VVYIARDMWFLEIGRGKSTHGEYGADRIALIQGLRAGLEAPNTTTRTYITIE
jgi:hypothetical protein